MEVPLSAMKPLPEPIRVENTETPGAEIDGFKALSPTRGPPELKLAAVPTKGLFSTVASMDSAVDPVNAAASPGWTPINGMVTPATLQHWPVPLQSPCL